MSRPYPYELRIRALKLIKDGMSVTKVKAMLNISRQALHQWIKLEEEGSDLKPKEGYQRGHNIKIIDLNEFKEFIDKNKDKSLKDLAKLSGKYSASTIWRGNKKLGYSYKKNFYSSQKR